MPPKNFAPGSGGASFNGTRLGVKNMFANISQSIASRRAALVTGVSAAMVTATAMSASAADVVTPVISSATTDLQGTLLATGGAAIGVGAVVLALRKGWKFFKGMI